MRRLLDGLLVAALLGFATSPAVAASQVWSIDTTKLDRAGLDQLEGRDEIVDWAELGERLLVSGGKELAEWLRASGLKSETVEGIDRLDGLLVVLSKHHGVESILQGRAKLIAHEGPFFLIRATLPGLARLRGEEDHRLRFVRLGRKQTIFRSPGHLPKVAPVDPAIAPLVDSVNRDRIDATLKQLIGFGTRYSYSPGIERAASWAVDVFKAAGLETRIVRYTSRGKQLPNVVAEMKGTSRPNDLYIVGGHLDSISWDSMTSAPGADDNGSGSAGVLEMARVLGGKRSEATVRFVLFSGEEQGLYGSKAYVEQLRQAGELSKVKAMINLDMISFDQAAPLDLMLEGRAISHPLSDRLQAYAAAHAPAAKVYRTDNAWGSDHVSFLDAKVPATLTIEYEYDDNGNEHSPKDIYEICNLDLAVAILRMDVGALAELAGIRP